MEQQTPNSTNPFSDSSQGFPFFPSTSHQKGLHRIVRGFESTSGLILLTGEIGVGKTSLSRHVQHCLSKRYHFVELGNPYQSPMEQLFYCCKRLRIQADGLSSIHDCVEKLAIASKVLLKRGKRLAIVFDESHLLTKSHLGLIHILSNLRVKGTPLVQILIVGQLELLDLLACKGMEALNQRIGVRHQLEPLTVADTEKYIHFKLNSQSQTIIRSFSRSAMRRISESSGGIPRLINHICAHLLDCAAFNAKGRITVDMINSVCRDSVYSGLFHSKNAMSWFHPTLKWLSVAGLAAALICIVTVSPLSSIGATTTVWLGMFSSQADKAWTLPGEPSEVLGSMHSDGAVDPDIPLTGEMQGEASSWLQSADVPEEVASILVEAIAWNPDPPKSFVVLNSELYHADEDLNGVRIVSITQDYVTLEYNGTSYQRSTSNQERRL